MVKHRGRDCSRQPCDLVSNFQLTAVALWEILACNVPILFMQVQEHAYARLWHVRVSNMARLGHRRSVFAELS